MTNRLLPFATLLAACFLVPVRIGLADDAGEMRRIAAASFAAIQADAGLTAAARAAGSRLFATHCASCHGADGKGRRMVGGPDLTDAHWTHGGDPASIMASVWDGRKGEMPGFEDRLGPAERKALTLHVLDLR